MKRTVEERIRRQIESCVREIQRRNGNSRVRLRPAMRLQDPQLGLDSLDIAEVFVWIEKTYGVASGDAKGFPHTWRDVISAITMHQQEYA